MRYTIEYEKDLKRIAGVITGIEKLRNCRIFVSGAGGLICSALVDFLMNLNEWKNAGIEVYAAGRSEARIRKRFSRWSGRPEFHYLPYDAMERIASEEQFDYFIHGASNANPAAYVREPVETMLANLIGIRNVLEYARVQGSGRVLYLSSSEVYGKKTTPERYREDEYGFLDILNPRACYPSSKRASETLCAAFLQEYGVDSVIVRPGHVYGPTATSSDNRASTQFPRDVLQGRDILMKSPGTQLRSYCYVLDCVSAMVTVLLNGQAGSAYNISNPNCVVTIRQMAEAFAKAGGRNVVFDNPTDAEREGYNLMDNSALDSDRLEALGWKGLFDLEAGVRATLDAMDLT